MVGKEIADVIWPIVKIGIPVAGILLAGFLTLRGLRKRAKRSGKQEAEGEAHNERAKRETSKLHARGKRISFGDLLRRARSGR